MKDITRRDAHDPRRYKSLKSSRQKPFKDVILKFIHLRYYPPGLILQYLDCQGKLKEKVIELLELSYTSNISRFSNEVLKAEPLLFSTKNHRTALVDALTKLKDRCLHDYAKRFVKQYAFFPHSCPVTNMCLSKDGKRCITTSNAENICSVWDLGGMRETALLQGHTKPITAISPSHFFDRALTGSEDGTVRVWELSSPSGLLPSSRCNQSSSTCQAELVVTKDKILCAEASSDFSMVASGCSDCSAYVHDLTNCIAMYRFSDVHSLEITNVQFDTSGNLLLTASVDGKAALFDLRSGNLISVLEGHKKEITNCTFDHLCQTVATCSLDSKVRLWDVRMLSSGTSTNVLYEFIENDDEIYSIHFDTRGKSLASGAKDGTLTAWDVKTGNLLFQIPNAHEGPIRTVRWSPNGALVMTASDDKTINLFHPDMATCIQTLSHHKGPVKNAAFCYSNEYLVTSGEDRSVVVYRLEKPLKNEPFVLSSINIRSSRLSAR
ncbi:Dynein assembly factor with WDR repeat domains 1 [Orchesella cincta]|uniref:Dynein assembly factor with WDR repeat domains 1 n=1 Tax=Orchesella cincta TaxID=48709 RepID=A0A1D2N545_ORCCI|nr:Dynein assembly factor with WDR repeat domains 1 [Orchesella cincta]